MNAETLREICLQFPFVKEEIKWGADLVFSIGGKMFCIATFDESFKASFKVPDEDFDEMCNCAGFIPAPYLARAKWVHASNEAGLSKEEWKNLLQQSYALVASKLTKKQKAEIGMA